MTIPVAILGGGLAGLSLGRKLKAAGVGFTLLEALPRVGGLCRGMRSGAYSWDLGPRSFFDRDPDSLRPLRELPLTFRALRQEARICHHSGGVVHEVGYPFERGLADLPLKDRLACVAGYWRAWGPRVQEWRFRNLNHWIQEGLGSGIGRCFMTPYNRKLWSVPLERISVDLVARKVEPERPWTMLRDSLLGGGEGRGRRAEFIYPELGAGAIPEALGRGLEASVRTGWQVRRLERRGGAWSILSDAGDEVLARRVVSTIPLPELLKALGEPGLRRFLPAFRFNHTRFALLGLKPGGSPARFGACHWALFAGPEVFHRVSLPHNFAPRPPALVAEVTLRDPAAQDSTEGLLERVVRDLCAAGLLGSADMVETAELHLEKYTHPIPTVGMREARAELEGLLSPRGLLLLGRSGRWEYLDAGGVLGTVETFWRMRGHELRDAEE